MASVLALAVALSACGGSSAKPTPTVATSSTATAEQTVTPTASPTVTATPTYAPPPTPSTAGLPGDIAAAIDAARAHDSARLESLITTTLGPCVVNPGPAILQPPTCPGGAAGGTLVPALIVGNCPDDPEFGYIDPAITYRITSFDPGMYVNLFAGVVELDGPMRYAALWATERVGWLGFDANGKLIGAGGGGGCPASELRPRLANATWLAGPAWSD